MGPRSWLPQTARAFLLFPQAALPAALVSLWVTVYSDIAIKIIPLFTPFKSPSSWACSFIQYFCHFNRILNELEIIAQNSQLNSVFY